MAKKKKPEPAKKKKAVPVKKKPEPAKKKKAVPAKKKPEPAKKKKAVPVKKPEPTKKEKNVSEKKNMPEPAESSATKACARLNGKELLRRALITALALLSCFGIVLSAVSVRGELLQKKVTFAYAGVLQRTCLLPIAFEESRLRNSLRATKRHGQTHAFTYFCNQTLQLNTENGSGYILFGNPAENDCTLVLSILDEKDNLLYRSDGVEPGKYITQIRLFSAPERDSVCRAYVSGYTGQDFRYKCVGVQYSRLMIEVGEPS